MQKEIKIIGKDSVRVTTLDERWYGYVEDSVVTGLPEVVWEPSVTWISSYYPKGIEYMRWVAKQGWDEAERIKAEAGDRGTIVHHACEELLASKRISINQKFKDRDGNERELTPDEYYHVMTFQQWYESVGCPKPIQIEQTVRSKIYGYSGTLDVLFEGGWLVDIKTSKDVWPSQELQISALKKALEQNGVVVSRMSIIQTGYTRNKDKHYKMTDIDDKFSLFLAAKEIWANECANMKPLQREYPLEIRINDVQLQRGSKAVSKGVRSGRGVSKANGRDDNSKGSGGSVQANS